MVDNFLNAGRLEQLETRAKDAIGRHRGEGYAEDVLTVCGMFRELLAQVDELLPSKEADEESDKKADDKKAKDDGKS